MDTGRKFWVTLVGVLAASLRPEAAGSVALMVGAFCGANAAVSYAYSKSDSTSRALTGTSDVERRRDEAAGVEPAP